MSSDKMFKKALFGLKEEEVLDYMDRLLAVIERQKERYAAGGRNGKHEFLVSQMRNDLAKEARRLRRRRRLERTVLVLCPILFLTALFCMVHFWAGAAEVTGDSMSPSLRAGDLVVYSRKKEAYRRGDMVVCDVEGTRIVKRVAGVPGDCVRLDGSGRVMIEQGVGNERIPVAGNEGLPTEIFLREKEYFLLGDNRDRSVDSRDVRIGPVEWGKIEGRVLFVMRAVRRE